MHWPVAPSAWHWRRKRLAARGVGPSAHLGSGIHSAALPRDQGVEALACPGPGVRRLGGVFVSPGLPTLGP